MRFLLFAVLSWGNVAILRAQVVAPLDSTVRCVVRTNKTEFYHREPIAFDVRLINYSKQPVVLVDGDINSSIWDCFPRPGFHIYRLRKRFPKKRLEKIPSLSCLKTWASSENFARVGPRQYMTLEVMQEAGVPLLFHSFKLYEHLTPGRYEVVFTYSTVTSASAISNFIHHQPKEKQVALQALVDRVARMNLSSAPIYLTITRAKKRG